MKRNDELIPTIRSQYLELIQAAARYHREKYDAELTAWRIRFDPDSYLAYDFPRFIFSSATFEGFLFSQTGELEYAQHAKKALLQLREIQEWFPTAFGEQRKRDPYGFWQRVPPVPPEAYAYLRGKGILSATEEALVEKWLVNYAEYHFNFHEWGAHNRALWATRDFARIIRLLPNHPAAPRWKKLCLHLLKTSWGNWSIEDAQIYLPLWLSKIMHIADILEIPGLYQEYNVLYYLNYFLQLIAPHGMVTDFGDARWQESWQWYLTCFERGAKEYSNPEFKWAAVRIFETKALSAAPQEIEIDIPFLHDCCDDAVPLTPPTNGSRMVLDELAGKKIVFRSGWEPDSSFLMLNYKGDQDYGRCDRDYLRETINVVAEKMHHGHTDENAICLLMSKGSVLLNDAGYRLTMTNGMYRADFYHNRLAIRNEAPDAKNPILHSLHQRTWYQPTRTEKIHFFNFEKWDYSRTRVTRAEEGWEWDRSIIYLKDLDIFVLFDTVRVLNDCFLNINNIFHTQQILSTGENWFDTRYRDISGWKNPGDRRLLIWFLPQPEMYLSTAETLRNLKVDRTILQTASQSYRAGQIIPLVTVLMPHDRGFDPAAAVVRFRPIPVTHLSAGVGLTITEAEGPVHLCLKSDLTTGLLADEVRPKYTFETGKIQFGEKIQTDARLLILQEKAAGIRYGFVEATRVDFNGQTIYEAPSVQPSIDHPNGEYLRMSRPKRDWWEDEVTVK